MIKNKQGIKKVLAVWKDFESWVLKIAYRLGFYNTLALTDTAMKLTLLKSITHDFYILINTSVNFPVTATCREDIQLSQKD